MAEVSSVVPVGGGIPVGVELSSFLRAEEVEVEEVGLVEPEEAFLAASCPAWRIANVRGFSVREEAGGARGGVEVAVEMEVDVDEG